MNDAPARVADTLRFAEIWRPMWMSGSPAFWRELTPQQNASVRLPGIDSGAGRLRFTPGPWCRMHPDTARKIAQLPNPYFTLDEYPGVTFCTRRFKDKHATDTDKFAVRTILARGEPIPL